MSVLAEALSVVVRRSVLDAKYPGGAAQYRLDCPNGTFCEDEHLTRVGFMTPEDVGVYITRLEREGLIFFVDGSVVDIAVVDQHIGPTAHCDWLAGGKYPDGYSAVWLAGTQPGFLAYPPGWTPEQSSELTFVSNEEVSERFFRLSETDYVETLLDFATGRVVYMGRTSRSRDERAEGSTDGRRNDRDVPPGADHSE